MLSEAVLAAYAKPEDDGFHRGQLTITGISPCPYGTYINYHKLDPHPASPEQILNMSNGHWQEAEVIANLTKAGYQMRYTGKDQLTVNVGRAKVQGRPDGLIWVVAREDILSVKAVNTRRFKGLKQRGIEAEPSIMCQEQMYMQSEELKGYAGCWVYAKHKDNNEPYDFFIERDDTYARPIVQATDAIICDGWEPPRPEVCPIPGGCRHRFFCEMQDVIDLSNIDVDVEETDMSEVTEQWKRGKFYKDYGSMIQKEAREVLIQRSLGKKNLVYVEDLKVTRILSNRSDFDPDALVALFGIKYLGKVYKSKPVEQIRITEVDT